MDRALDVPAGVNLPMDLKDAAQVPQWAAQAVQDALSKAQYELKMRELDQRQPLIDA